MFDYAVTPPKRSGRPRYLTTMVSAVIHVLVVVCAIFLPVLYASEALPDPPDMLAFVVEAPLPPPPPPPPPPEVAKPEPAKPDAAPVRAEPVRPRQTVAAPTEAPREIKPETGAEGAMKTGKPAVEAGFERGVTGGIEGGVVGGIESAPPPPPLPPPRPPKPSGPVRVGGKIKAPELAHRVNPVYPPVAQRAQVEGRVVVEATVGTSGNVESVRIVRGHPLLEGAAVAAVKQWRYEPLLLNGEPVPFILTVTVSFSIPR